MPHNMVIFILLFIVAYHITLRREKCPLQDSGIARDQGSAISCYCACAVKICLKIINFNIQYKIIDL